MARLQEMKEMEGYCSALDYVRLRLHCEGDRLCDRAEENLVCAQ